MAVELVDRRTDRTKTYHLGDDNYRLVSSQGPIHYEKDGEWVDMTTDIQNGRVHRCRYDVRLLDGKIGYEGTDPKGKHIRLELEGKQYREPEIEGNVATYKGIDTDEDFQLVFCRDRIKALRILHSDRANPVCHYLSYKEDGAAGKVINAGVDNDQRPTRLSVTETDFKGGKRISQEFMGEVLEIDPKTRKRAWSKDVVYPLVIDPTSTFTPSANSKDGKMWYYGYGTQITTVNTGLTSVPCYHIDFLSSKIAGWILFSISGISKNDTINSADLECRFKKTQLLADVVDQCKIHFWKGTGATTSSDTHPALTPASTSGAEISVKDFLIGNNTASTTTATFTGLGLTTTWHTETLDVTTMVQNLVNSYYYTNHEMFCCYSNLGAPTSSYVSGLRMAMRNHATENEPRLIINYTGAGGGGSTYKPKIIFS